MHFCSYGQDFDEDFTYIFIIINLCESVYLDQDHDWQNLSNLGENMSDFPHRIVCITEEAVEFLFAIGEGHRVVGVSAYVQRPKEAKKLPKVSAFINGSTKKIKALDPDLVLGFSDIQKDLAKDLIGEGLNVFIANHRSIEGIFNYMKMLGNLVGKEKETRAYLKELRSKIDLAKDFSKTLDRRPSFYIEEWDEPRITGIEWFSEIVELCGGKNVFHDRSNSPMAKDRYVDDKEVIEKNPDFILACWCGKEVDIASIEDRSGYSGIEAVKNKRVIELRPEIFLQPGPAPIVSGIDQIIEIFKDFK